MKTFHLVRAAAFAAVAAPALAQSPFNPFIVFPQDPERQPITAASYVRRPDWNLAAEGFQQVTQDLFRGVGDVGAGVSVARGFYHWAGDLDNATPETYGIVLRREDPILGGPDVTPAGVIVQVNNLTTPIGAGGNGGWILTDVFATPAALPQNASWYQGMFLPANPAWPSGSPPDGHSIWAADTLAANTPATVGENGRLNAPPVTWRVNAAGVAARTQWTYIMGTLVENPVLHVGGIDPLSSRTGTPGAPSYGMNGLFPDVSGSPRSDGLQLRMQDNQLANGIAVFAGSFGWFPVPVPIGYGGDLHLDLTTVVLLGAGVPTGGAAVVPLATPGTLSPALIGQTVMFQGLWLDPLTGAGRMANAQATSF
jgi:hypothetical protein